MDCQVEAKTQTAGSLMSFAFHDCPLERRLLKKDIFSVHVPADAIEWRVTGEYQYYKHHNMRLGYFGWLVDDLKLGRAEKQPPKIVVYPLIGIGWVFSLLPESKEEFGQIHSELFTNRPPMVLSVPLTQP